MRQAVDFFQKVVNDKEPDTEPKYIKLARFQWESLKDTPASEDDEEMTLNLHSRNLVMISKKNF